MEIQEIICKMQDYKKEVVSLSRRSERVKTYTYLKDIILDEEKQEKYGDSREGFLEFKKEFKVESAEDCLRKYEDGYVLERINFISTEKEQRETYYKALDFVVESFGGEERL